KLIDVTTCIGCKACQVACSEWNDIRDEVGNNVGVYDNPADLTMLNQQYVVPEGLQPYQGVTANSPWLASETEKRRRKICDSL
ncbi:hypothetical protein MJM83_34560, partial [Salmonella enterica subsp. enterica serovar Montevideo]|nr:hypothetical protein [Salmonella enterica subsp. enterica serovar Montevideo]